MLACKGSEGEVPQGEELSWSQFALQRTLGRGASGVAELVQRKSDGMLLVIKVIPVCDHLVDGG